MLRDLVSPVYKNFVLLCPVFKTYFCITLSCVGYFALGLCITLPCFDTQLLICVLLWYVVDTLLMVCILLCHVVYTHFWVCELLCPVFVYFSALCHVYFSCMSVTVCPGSPWTIVSPSLCPDNVVCWDVLLSHNILPCTRWGKVVDSSKQSKLNSNKFIPQSA